MLCHVVSIHSNAKEREMGDNKERWLRCSNDKGTKKV